MLSEDLIKELFSTGGLGILILWLWWLIRDMKRDARVQKETHTEAMTVLAGQHTETILALAAAKDEEIAQLRATLDAELRQRIKEKTAYEKQLDRMGRQIERITGKLLERA